MSEPTGETILARLTPAGKAAIAVLGLVGPDAWTAVRSLLRRSGDKPVPEEPSAGALYHGRLGEGPGGADEVMVLVRSVGPESVVEVHCHGGLEVVRLLQQHFESRNVRSVDAATWIRRTFPDVATGASVAADRAEALEVLANCPTVRTAGIALDYVQGAFERSSGDFNAECKDWLHEAARRRIERLAALLPVARHLVDPWKVIVAGAPNAGKSTLVNALAGYTRSLVSPLPGTTRDLVTTRIALEGWPIELTDTAGLRASADSLEWEGVALARQAMDDADLVLWLVDGTIPPAAAETRPERSILVVTKSDLPSARSDADAEGVCRISAVTGQGLEPLCAAIARALVPVVPESGEAVPITSGARYLVQRMIAGITRGAAL